MNENPATQAITGNFTLQAQLPQGKMFTINGYIYDGESVESINQRVDLLHDVVDRQRTRAEIPEIEAKVNQTIEMLSDNAKHYGILLARRDKGQTLKSNEKLMLEQMDVNTNAFKEKIEDGRKRLAEMRASLNGAHPAD